MKLLALFRRTGRRKPSRREGWREASALLGGRLVEGRRASADEILLEHGPWTVRLASCYQQTGEAAIPYTRARATFRGLRELRLEIRRRNAFDRLVQALGFGGQLRVPPALATAHMVRGSPEARLPALLTTTGLVQAVLAAPGAELRVERASRKLRRRYGQDVGLVTCQRSGIRTDPAELSSLVSVVTATLDALEGVGEARREPSPDAPETP